MSFASPRTSYFCFPSTRYPDVHHTSPALQLAHLREPLSQLVGIVLLPLSKRHLEGVAQFDAGQCDIWRGPTIAKRRRRLLLR